MICLNWITSAEANNCGTFLSGLGTVGLLIFGCIGYLIWIKQERKKIHSNTAYDILDNLYSVNSQAQAWMTDRFSTFAGAEEHKDDPYNIKNFIKSGYRIKDQIEHVKDLAFRLNDPKLQSLLDNMINEMEQKISALQHKYFQDIEVQKKGALKLLQEPRLEHFYQEARLILTQYLMFK
jgi:hypothetical protein